MKYITPHDALMHLVRLARDLDTTEAFIKFLNGAGYEANKPYLERLEIGDRTHAWRLAHERGYGL